MSETSRTKVVLIANPHAGRGGAHRARAIDRFCQGLARHGIHVEVAYTAGPNDAARLAADAAHRGIREVAVSGGDGTINEALQSLVGRDMRLGIWPAGTANVLARELALPFAAEAAAEVLACGRTRRLSIGCATQEGDGEGVRRYFLLMAGIGIDASVVESVPTRLKRRVGEAAFWYSGLGHLARWRPKAFIIEGGGETIAATFAAIGKAPRYGGGLAITPRARLDGAEFEVCLVNSRSRIRYLYLLSHALRPRGVAEGMRAVRFLRATRLRATGDALVQTDGELIGRLPMTFEMTPFSIEVFTP